MQQIVQDRGKGRLRVIDVPVPMATAGHVVIANRASLISAGTERMVRDLAQMSLLQKAMKRPDDVRRVIEKIRQEGLLATVRQVKRQLDDPMPLGYSSTGVVIACGDGVEGLGPGDRVASNGPHAGAVSVPRHLCARVPEGVTDEQAAFGVLGAIAMQGARLAETSVGETVFVIGLGLVGQLSVAILSAAGVRVLATDLDAGRCETALEMGAREARPGLGAAEVMDSTRGLGADAIVVAAATSSNEPVELAAQAVRKKGRIVLVGAVGMELPRTPLYEKEAEVVVSCSYGPGRYDPGYEERGIDYPPAYVRWTEQRNLAAVLDLMATGRLAVEPLVTHRFPVDRAAEAYDMIEAAAEPCLGVLLQYPGQETPEVAAVGDRRVRLRADAAGDGVGIGCLGAGNFAGSVLLPAVAGLGERVRLRALCSATGLSAVDTGERLGFEIATTDVDSVIADDAVQALFIATRHNLHAEQVRLGLRAGKHVFVEKPLALTVEELEGVELELRDSGDPSPLLMIGFNRRFSPAAEKVRALFADRAFPLTVSVRFNAGAIAPDHWTQNELEGGGRIVGEACHAIDLATYLIGSPPVRVFAEGVGGADAPEVTQDQCFITLRHADGSISSIAYLAGGDRAYPKERVEVMGGGRVGVIEDFREVVTVSNGRVSRNRSFQRDKGHRQEVERFLSAVLEGGAGPISWADQRAVSLAAILAARSLREGVPFEIPAPPE